MEADDDVDGDAVDVGTTDDASFVLFLLFVGAADGVDDAASSFVGFLFGIAPEDRRTSGVGWEEDVSATGVGTTSIGWTTAFACFQTK